MSKPVLRVHICNPNTSIRWEVKDYVLNSLTDMYDIIFVGTPEEAQLIYVDRNECPKYTSKLYVHYDNMPSKDQDYDYAHPEMYVNGRLVLYRADVLNSLYGMKKGDIKSNNPIVSQAFDIILSEMSDKRAKFLQMLKSL